MSSNCIPSSFTANTVISIGAWKSDALTGTSHSNTFVSLNISCKIPGPTNLNTGLVIVPKVFAVIVIFSGETNSLPVLYIT